MPGRRQPAGDGKDDLAADRRADVAQQERDEQSDVAVLIDQSDDEMLQGFHVRNLTPAPGRCFASPRGAGSRRPDCRPRDAEPRIGRSARSRDFAARSSASETILRTRGVTKMPSQTRSSPLPSVRRTSAWTSRDVDAVRIEARAESPDRALRARLPADVRRRRSSDCGYGTLVRRCEARAAMLG